MFCILGGVGTKDNLAIIAQDCAKGLYGRAHLNFVTKLDRALMEDFAKLVVQSGSLETVAGVHDQYLDFVCLEQQLFSLGKKNSYTLYNGSGANEAMIESVMTEIAYGLFSVVATLGKVPVIRCPKVSATIVSYQTSQQLEIMPLFSFSHVLSAHSIIIFLIHAQGWSS